MSVSNHPSSRPLVLLAMVLCAALVTVGCSKGSDKKSTSQVAVKVNGEELSVHQVDLVMRRQQANVPPAQQEAMAKRLVEGLVDQELAAQAARKDKLDQDPRVVQQMEAAKRDVLARAYLERLGEKVTEPSSDEIARYYETHPNLFSQRRLYSLQETNFAIDPQKAPAMKARLEATTSLDKMNEVLRGESVQFTARQTSVSAEDVPLAILDQLATLKEGQSLVLTRDGAGRVLTLINAQLAPVGPVPAKRLIAGYLTNDRKRTTLQEGVKALREQAKIEYQGRFAELVSGAASAPGGAAAPEAASAASAP
jgi:EpsD family peptidyl-prolyl cis-trans isomerase